MLSCYLAKGIFSCLCVALCRTVSSCSHLRGYTSAKSTFWSPFKASSSSISLLMQLHPALPTKSKLPINSSSNIWRKHACSTCMQWLLLPNSARTLYFVWVADKELVSNQIGVITCLVMLSLLRQNHHRPDFFGILSLTQDSTVACKQSVWVNRRSGGCKSLIPHYRPRTLPSYRMSDALHTAQTHLCFQEPRKKGNALLLCFRAVLWCEPSGPQGSASRQTAFTSYLWKLWLLWYKNWLCKWYLVGGQKVLCNRHSSHHLTQPHWCHLSSVHITHLLLLPILRRKYFMPRFHL